MPRAGIALGSNLGDSAAQLDKAAALLAAVSTPGEPFLRAPVYRTAPVNCPPDSPDFLNTVVEIGFNGSPLELLEITQNIERQLGRVPHPVRNAPRPIDVDILYLGDTTFDNGTLVLPHPRIAERLFVLQPLAEIRPELILPGQRHSVAALKRAALESLTDATSTVRPVPR